MKLRIGKVVDGEERIMFALSEMGEAGVEWFVSLEEKPENWEEMKKLLIKKWNEEEEMEMKSEEEKRREEILKNIIEQEVEKRMEKLKPAVMMRSAGKVVNEYGRNEKWNRTTEEAKCYRCGELGHVRKGCRKKLGYKDKENKEEQDYSYVLLEQPDERKSKRKKLNLTSLMHEFSDVVYSSKSKIL
jgi:hypothetical protein